MYVAPMYVDTGLKEGQIWPSPAHRQIAVVIIVANPNVRNKDCIEKIVQAICKVPAPLIKKVSYKQLVSTYKMPDVGMYRLINN